MKCRIVLPVLGRLRIDFILTVRDVRCWLPIRFIALRYRSKLTGLTALSTGGRVACDGSDGCKLGNKRRGMDRV